MIRFFIVSLGVVVIAFAVGFGLTGTVAAQENTTDTNLTEEEIEEITSVIESESEADTLTNQQEIRLSSSLRILGWEFADGQLRLGVEADRPQNIAIADGVAGMGESGATRVPIVEQRVFGDEPSVIVMPVEEFGGGHAVTVSAGGESIRLSTAMDTSGEDPLNHFGGHSGLFSGIMMTILMSVGGAGFVLWREDSGVEKA